MGAFFAGTTGGVLFVLVVLGQTEPGRITGVFSDPTGRPLPGATVVIASGDMPPRAVVTDENGRYGFPALPPANYRVEARMPGFLTKPTELVLLPGGSIEWGGALLLGSTSNNRSVENHVLGFIGPNAIDCGRYISDSVDSTTLRRSLECGILAARDQRSFSLILQYSTVGPWVFEGLMAKSDGEIRSFTYSSRDGELETESCPLPTVPTHGTVSAPRISCHPSQNWTI